jgi:hypothetical protein
MDYTPEQSLPTQPVADGRMSAPIEVSSAHSAANITPQPHVSFDLFNSL